MSLASRCWANRMLLGLLAAILAACGAASDSVPQGLLQIWRTDAPAYKGKYFELRDGTLIFGTGPHAFAMHSVEHIEVTLTANGSVEYVFDYRDNDGETAQVRFVHTPGPPATIRMANRDEVWTPQKKSFREDWDG